MNNSSSTEVVLIPSFKPTAGKIIIAICLTFIVVITIAGNLLVLLSFLNVKLRHPFNYYIFNLAITDFLVAVTAMSFYTIDTILGYWPFSQGLCAMWIYFDYAMTFSSVFTLVAISVDRFWSVTWIQHHRQHNTNKKTTIILIFVWICVLLVWTPPFIADAMKPQKQYQCIWEPSENLEFIIAVDIVGHYLPCLLMVCSYIKVYLVMRRQRRILVMSSIPGQNVSLHSAVSVIRRDLPQNTSNTIQHLNQRSSSRERRIFFTLTYIVISYLICWFPFYVAWDIYAWNPNLVPDWLYTLLFWMTYMNSTMNPLLYAYTNKDFRSTFKKILKCEWKSFT